MTVPYDYQYKVHRNVFQRAWDDPWVYLLGFVVGAFFGPWWVGLFHLAWHGLFGHPAPIPFQCVDLSNGGGHVTLWVQGQGVVHCYVPKTLPTHGPVST